MHQNLPPRAILLFVVLSMLITFPGCDRGAASESATESLPATTVIDKPIEDAVSTTEELPSFDAEPAIENSIVIGLDADMTSGSARSGEAIRRGIVLAIDEINSSGGLLGRPVELVVRDHRGNPDRGKNNITEFGAMRDVVAVVGGIHTPVAIQQLPEIHRLKLPYLGAWAAGTPVVANGHSPNFVFRVSVRDEYAGGFLVRQAVDRGHKRIGLLLERTAWGRSNEKAITEALSDEGLESVAVEWLNWGQTDLSAQFQSFCNAEADVVLLVCNALEGVSAIKSAAALPRDVRPEIISHWGISGGRFFSLAKADLEKVNVSFLQTFSFVNPRRPGRAEKVFESYRQRFPDCQTPADIFAPVGTAQAYEIVNMLATAVEMAGTIDSEGVHRELENLRDYRGLIRDYERPFPPDHHDALTADDFILATFAEDGTITPVTP